MSNTTTVIDLRQFVAARNGEACTTSSKVAEAFGKQHKDVLRKLVGLECSPEFNGRNFAPVEYLDAKGEKRPAFEMTKDGFIFLVMSFTGKKAAQIKEGYIAAFNWMAEQLGISSTDLVGSVIGTSGVNVLDRVIDQKASPVPPALVRSFKHTMKSRLRSRFNVPRTDLIPAAQLADACNFIAAYALEGEWLAKEPEVAGPMLSRADLLNLNALTHYMGRVREIYVRYDMFNALGALGSRAGVELHDYVSDGNAVAGSLRSRFKAEIEQAQTQASSTCGRALTGRAAA